MTTALITTTTTSTIIIIKIIASLSNRLRCCISRHLFYCCISSDPG